MASGGIGQHVPRLTPEKASEELTRMARVHLGVAVDPVQLRVFMRDYWNRLSLYAHTIHAEGAGNDAAR